MTQENKELTPIEIKKQIEDQQAKLKEIALALMPKEALDVVNAAKAKGIKPYVVQIVDDFFIYRTLKRSEWKTLVEKQFGINKSLSSQTDDQDLLAIHAEMRMEEELVLAATIWPTLDQISIKQLDAGQIETLASQIKLTSGFGQQPTVIKLN